MYALIMLEVQSFNMNALWCLKSYTLLVLSSTACVGNPADKHFEITSLQLLLFYYLESSQTDRCSYPLINNRSSGVECLQKAPFLVKSIKFFDTIRKLLKLPFLQKA